MVKGKNWLLYTGILLILSPFLILTLAQANTELSSLAQGPARIWLCAVPDGLGAALIVVSLLIKRSK